VQIWNDVGIYTLSPGEVFDVAYSWPLNADVGPCLGVAQPDYIAGRGVIWVNRQGIETPTTSGSAGSTYHTEFQSDPSNAGPVAFGLGVVQFS